jgi:hypothetical protein
MQLKLENDIYNTKNPPKSSQKHPGSHFKNTTHPKLTSQSINLIDIRNPKPVDYSLPSSCISAFSTITFNLSSRLNIKNDTHNTNNSPETLPKPYRTPFKVSKHSESCFKIPRIPNLTSLLIISPNT